MLHKIERGVFLTYLDEEKKAAKKGEACEFEVAPLTDQEKLEWDLRQMQAVDKFKGDDPVSQARAINEANLNMFLQVCKKINNGGDEVMEIPESIAAFAKEYMTLEQRSEINAAAREGGGQTDHIDKMRLKNA